MQYGIADYLYIMWVITRVQVILQILYILCISVCGAMNSCGGIILWWPNDTQQDAYNKDRGFKPSK
jgi:hypothetical protein